MNTVCWIKGKSSVAYLLKGNILRKNKKIEHSLLFLAVFFLCFIGDCFAGNLSIIEKRLKELDALNKQVIRRVTDIPENGNIHAVLDIPLGGDIEKATVQDLSIDIKPLRLPFTIQISSSTDRDRTLEVAKKLHKANFSPFVSTPFQHKGNIWWRIYIGSYQSRESAQKAYQDFQDRFVSEGFIVKKPYALQVGEEVDEFEANELDKYLQGRKYFPYVTQGEKEGGLGY